MYLSESDHFTKFNEKSSLIWHEADITFGNYSDERASFLHIPVSAEVQHNASLYAHIFLSHSKSSPNPAMPSYDVDKTLYLRQREYTIDAVWREAIYVIPQSRFQCNNHLLQLSLDSCQNARLQTKRT